MSDEYQIKFALNYGRPEGWNYVVRRGGTVIGGTETLIGASWKIWRDKRRILRMNRLNRRYGEKS
jgi:hypothetical protein